MLIVIFLYKSLFCFSYINIFFIFNKRIYNINISFLGLSFFSFIADNFNKFLAKIQVALEKTLVKNADNPEKAKSLKNKINNSVK